MLLAIRVFLMGRTGLMFRKNAHGGTNRGVTWKPFAPQYTRKDGTVIPAWGGVRKVRGVGNVKPRKRPSGKPITQSSLLMQDVGKLRSQRLDISRLTPSIIKFGPTLSYAQEQHDLRPWSFFTPKEVVKSADSAFRVFTRHTGKP